MRATYAKIYRDLEHFLYWAGSVVDRAPRLPSVEELGRQVLQDISDAMSITSLALQQEKGPARTELLKALRVRLQHIDSVFGYFVVISRDIPQHDGPTVKARARILTPKQKSTFTTMMHNLHKQADDWYNRNGETA